jgi:hypothetical protein
MIHATIKVMNKTSAAPYRLWSWKKTKDQNARRNARKIK